MAFSEKIDLSLAPKMERDLKEQGFELSKPQHTVFSARKPGITCTLYTSGKLVIQGKQMQEFIEFYIEPHILKSFSYTYGKDVDMTPRIGSDEAGKGDFFGPLCVASVYAGQNEIEALIKLGVKDSKGFRDVKILSLAKEIEKICPHHIVVINPTKYNELYEKFQNLNSLLAWAHATAIHQLVEQTGCRRVIVDQFAKEFVLQRAMDKKKKELDLIQRTRGEEDIVVAAGSILARKTFVDTLGKMEKRYGMALPKGASKETIRAGREFVKRHGDRLKEVGKLHFKTTLQILGE